MQHRMVSLEKVQNLLGQEGLADAEQQEGVEQPIGRQQAACRAKETLRAALPRELTARQLECVKLYYFENMTEAQAAEHLGISKPTVCRHLQKARARLERVIAYTEALHQYRAEPPEG